MKHYQLDRRMPHSCGTYSPTTRCITVDSGVESFVVQLATTRVATCLQYPSAYTIIVRVCTGERNGDVFGLGVAQSFTDFVLPNTRLNTPCSTCTPPLLVLIRQSEIASTVQPQFELSCFEKGCTWGEVGNTEGTGSG